MNIQCSFCDETVKVKRYDDLPDVGWQHQAKTPGGVISRLVACPDHKSEFEELCEDFYSGWRSIPMGWDLHHKGTVVRPTRRLQYHKAKVEESICCPYFAIVCCKDTEAHRHPVCELTEVAIENAWVTSHCVSANLWGRCLTYQSQEALR